MFDRTTKRMAASVNRVVLDQHSSFGRSAYAAHAVKAGDLVLCEQPLLSYGSDSADSSLAELLQLVQQQLERPEHAATSSTCEDGSWQQACAELLAFCRAPTETQDKVLNGMFNTPQGPGNESSAPVRRAALQSNILACVAAQIKAVLQAEGTWRDGSVAQQVLASAADIQRMLLSFELNAHMTTDGRALFEFGSKLPHTCDVPNTTYAFCQGSGCHIATRDIAAGELLTSCYFGHRYLLLDTYTRQTVLQYDFGFCCQCQRCCQLDSLAALPCQACAPAAARRDAATGLLSSSLKFKVQHGSSSGSSGSSGSDSGHVKVLAVTGSEVSTKDTSTVGLLCYQPSTAQNTHSSAQCAAARDNTGSQQTKSSCQAGAPASAHDVTDAQAAAAAAAPAAVAATGLWACSQCGVQLPSTGAAMFGQQGAQPGSGSLQFDPLLHLRASICPKVLNCRSVVAGSCQEPLQQVQQVQQLLSMVWQWVGPFHWAVHFVMSAQTDYLRSWLLEAATDTAAAAAAAVSAPVAAHSLALPQLQQAAEQISSCMQQTWSWLTDWAGMTNEQAAYIMCQPLVHNACALLESAAQLLQPLPLLQESGQAPSTHNTTGVQGQSGYPPHHVAHPSHSATAISQRDDVASTNKDQQQPSNQQQQQQLKLAAHTLKHVSLCEQDAAKQQMHLPSGQQLAGRMQQLKLAAHSLPEHNDDAQQQMHLPGGQQQQQQKQQQQQQQQMHLPSGQQLARRLQQLGEALLARAEPRLAQLRCWPAADVAGLSQQQLAESVAEAREALAAAQAAVLRRGAARGKC